MRFSEDNYKAYETLVFATEKELREQQKAILKQYYPEIIETDGYILAIGEIPIALVAHMDTVFQNPPRITFFDRVKGVIWAPGGMGADDRAGIYAIDTILAAGLRPTVILTTGEESGGIGAKQLVKDYPVAPTEIKYVIQLDRANSDDCVFYDCDNPRFNNYVESFGFKTAIGSFTDISFICPAWKMAGVNLSIGYYNEHSVSEVLLPEIMLETIDKVINMLSETEIPYFEYIPDTSYSKYANFNFGLDNPTEDDYGIVKCAHCGEYFLFEETMQCYDENGNITTACDDCIINNGDFCEQCGSPFLLTAEEKEYRARSIYIGSCYKCREKENDIRNTKKSKKHLTKLSNTRKA